MTSTDAIAATSAVEPRHLDDAVIKALTTYVGNAKYQALVAQVFADIGYSSVPALWLDLRLVVKRLQRGGRIEYVKGPRGGWRVSR